MSPISAESLRQASDLLTAQRGQVELKAFKTRKKSDYANVVFVVAQT